MVSVQVRRVGLHVVRAARGPRRVVVDACTQSRAVLLRVVVQVRLRAALSRLMACRAVLLLCGHRVRLRAALFECDFVGGCQCWWCWRCTARACERVAFGRRVRVGAVCFRVARLLVVL